MEKALKSKLSKTVIAWMAIAALLTVTVVVLANNSSDQGGSGNRSLGEIELLGDATSFASFSYSGTAFVGSLNTTSRCQNNRTVTVFHDVPGSDADVPVGSGSTNSSAEFTISFTDPPLVSNDYYATVSETTNCNPATSNTITV